jgi:hypothetical protein
LAAYLDRYSPSAPLALDWGLDAPVRFLTAGRVNPVEVFGYTGLDQPDAAFSARLEPFLQDPNTLYIAHSPDQTVFQGRAEALAVLAAQRGLVFQPVETFGMRSGRMLFVVYRAARP